MLFGVTGGGGDGRHQEAEVAVADCCDRVCVCVGG